MPKEKDPSNSKPEAAHLQLLRLEHETNNQDLLRLRLLLGFPAKEPSFSCTQQLPMVDSFLSGIDALNTSIDEHFFYEPAYYSLAPPRSSSTGPDYQEDQPDDRSFRESKHRKPSFFEEGIESSPATSHDEHFTQLQSNLAIQEEIRRRLSKIAASLETASRYRETLIRVLDSERPGTIFGERIKAKMENVFSDEDGTMPPILKTPLESIDLPYYLRWSSKERGILADAVHRQLIKLLALCQWNSSDPQEKSVTSKDAFLRIRSEDLSKLSFVSVVEAAAAAGLQVDWVQISEAHLPSRFPEDCLFQWNAHLHPMISKAPWSDEETRRLFCLAERGGNCNWQEIAIDLGTGRTPSQCLSRFVRSRPEHKSSKWSNEDDSTLRNAVALIGEGHWQAVANCLLNRTGQQCLHRWRKVLNPTIRKGKWTLEEDEMLLNAVVQCSKPLSWSQVSVFVRGRTDVQCRERYCNVLNPSLQKQPWTLEEDKLLRSIVLQQGTGHWSMVSRGLAGRTDNQCMRRWRVLSKAGGAF